ncbi:MAG: bifunctional nicotinamidase/pyrazinamidase [Verrucomicrobiota bacterium]
MSKKALVIVDVQNDFVPGGALAVKGGDQVVDVINRIQPEFDLIVATQDWHPANHGSFAKNHPGKKPGDVVDLNGLPQILWPVHCVQRTRGAEFVRGLATHRVSRVFFKGTDPTIDSYSALFDNGHRKATGLGDYLKQQGADEVYIVGLATDYCVKFTALDARKLGFNTHLITRACRGVNLQPGDTDAAIEEMRKAGVVIEP